MLKYLSLFPLMVGLLISCFKTPISDNFTLPPNTGDGLTDEQLKNAFYMNVEALWSDKDQVNTEESLQRTDLGSGEYKPLYNIDTTLGVKVDSNGNPDNSHLPSNPVLSISYLQTDKSNTMYNTPISVEVQLVRPNGKKESFSLQSDNQGKFQVFLNLNISSNNKGVYTFYAVAKRQGHSGTLIYNLPTMRINVLRHTDEYYYPRLQDAFYSFWIEAKNKQLNYLLAGQIGFLDEPLQVHSGNSISYNEIQTEEHNYTAYYWFNNKQWITLNYTLHTLKKFDQVILTFKITGNSSKRSKSVIVPITINDPYTQTQPFILKTIPDINCPDTNLQCPNEMKSVEFSLESLIAFDGRYWLRINKADTENQNLYRYVFKIK